MTSMITRTCHVSFLLAAWTALSSVAATAGVLGKTAEGRPEIKSIHALSFAENGVLLVGDGAGSQIFAIDTGDTKPQKALAGPIKNVNAEIAGRLGAPAEGIEILDLAVNPASGVAYLAVRKQDDKSYVILKVAGAGEIGELTLDEVRYARIKLSAGKVRISRITDLAWGDDRVLAAGRASETFASKIFSIPAPLDHESVGNVFSAETYHVSHGRWETKAPMSVVIPFKQGDETYVVGAFSCTPVVKYPISALQPGAKVKGVSVVELGSGNRPLDMFVYEKDGKPYVLANTFRFHHERKPFGPSPYWTVKFPQQLLAEDENVNEQAVRRLTKNYKPATERIEMVEAYHGVMQMDRLDAKRALVLRSTGEGIDLAPLPLP